MRGTVLRIEKTSVHDGGGLRTVVFLKGCPLRCVWCSTPESQSSGTEFGYGKIMTAAEVVEEIAKDEIFYFHSGGGVTISGGEPLAQADFTAAILMEAKKRAVGAAIETCMHGSFADLQKILPYLDVLIADIKHIDSAAHKELTGVGNDLILENIRTAAEVFDGEIILRIPLIPGLNMAAGNAEGIAGFCARLGRSVKIELLPYHRLGLETYRHLNRERDFLDVKTPTGREIKEFEDAMRGAAPRKANLTIL